MQTVIFFVSCIKKMYHANINITSDNSFLVLLVTRCGYDCENAQNKVITFSHEIFNRQKLL